jgi:hypothetical protein
VPVDPCVVDKVPSRGRCFEACIDDLRLSASQVHCAHVGPTGGGKCIDVEYNDVSVSSISHVLNLTRMGRYSSTMNSYLDPRGNRSTVRTGTGSDKNIWFSDWPCITFHFPALLIKFSESLDSVL